MQGYYFITDSNLSVNGNLCDVREAVRAEVCYVQFREKKGSTLSLYREALRLRSECIGTKTKFIVNDRIDIALAVDADGVHIGQDDMPLSVVRSILGPNKIIGVTVHNEEEAIEAEKGGADYIGLAPVFATSTKEDSGNPCGVELISEIKRKLPIPVAAIGGINLDNALDVINAGADMICAISAVVTKDDVFGEIKKFQRLFFSVPKEGQKN
ncbi:MAG: thiamine phosphate synthase [Spirochaetes bacterium]|nr:thiamine phosphate synthase [Spirochaetota bacterium]